MSDRDITLYIVDILIAIDKIKRYTNDFENATVFLHSELQWDATIRELQIIGDATNLIIKYGLIENSFRRIVDFRNQIVHAYFGIDEEIVWQVVTEKLLDFNNELMNIVKIKHIDIDNAIRSAIKEYSYNKNVVEFLRNV